MTIADAVKKFLVLCFVWMGLTVHSWAHYVWVEPSGENQAKVYFGEFDEGKHEKTGGRLDEISKLEFWQWHPRAEKPATAKWVRKEDHFLVSELGGHPVLLAQDLAHEVADMRKYESGIVKPMYYARFQRSGQGQAADPFLDLDIAWMKDNVCRVFFHKQPLPGAKITIYAPNGWKQEHKTDDSGQAALQTPWPGQYVLEVIHKEAAPGTFGGKEYEAVRHRATCAFIQK